jgi:hypothetical protein
MKNILLVLLVFISSLSFSQIYGDIAKDKRPIIQKIEFGLKANYTGQIVFDIIVDEKGNVTVCKVNKAKTSVRSTPTMMKAKNRIIMHLKFKASSMYPEFHKGQVVIKVYK